MQTQGNRANLKNTAIHRNIREIEIPQDQNGRFLRVSQYYGENTFDFMKAYHAVECINGEFKNGVLDGDWQQVYSFYESSFRLDMKFVKGDAIAGILIIVACLYNCTIAV